ncbi:HAD family hydrolase [Clostridium botulinum]|uniref:D-glycero-alpha-D-manno-heptose-1,7-bisphosphate 7-phosphatase n=1 Tax=Clostridium botulinum TaxID=1491 RepID=UPI00196797E5|nr:HAD family hydrolase [Clostridium botulinum]MBN1075620.1 HAD family hydrolase [Clostridium botulinum]
MNKAVFLDRDGTINIEKNYLYKIEAFEFIEGVPEAIKMLNDAGYLVIVVTNQAGIARGYYTEEDMYRLHEHINDELKKYDAHIDEFYFCPHHPECGIGKYKLDCNCRKPKSGMLEEAIKKYNIDKNRSYIIGDKDWDVESGENIGIKGYKVDNLLNLKYRVINYILKY